MGDGPQKKKLMSLCHSLGLKVCDWKQEEGFCEADVYFMGYQKNIFKFLINSRVFALTSSWEGFPNVLAEALILKVSVVTTDCHTGPREILGVSGLPSEPVEEPLRTTVGSLMPLLTTPSHKQICEWCSELIYWLENKPANEQDFKKLVSRFTQAEILPEWKKIIENREEALL